MTATRVATDIGGTFTDLVYFRTDPATGRQEIHTAKADTTPPHFERGVFRVLEDGGLRLQDIEFLAHGTTTVINALTERKGVKTGLITTSGFRDVLEIARGNRPDYFNLRYRKPEPFVPRYLRREVPGRLTKDGVEREPLDLDVLPEIVGDFLAHGVEAIAICLLHAYSDPSHECAVAERVRELAPGMPVIASHQISRQWREYERTSTTVLSAYVQPTSERYLANLASGLGERGFAGQLFLMQSNCGVDSLDKTRQTPITMVESGPASGVWGAAQLGRLIGEPDVLALDIGGTTAKCSLIQRGQVKIASSYAIERDRRSAGYPLMVPVVDLVEIGNGGGSIAWVDDFGKLRVGPHSAGAVPGPAAYGRGGEHATTTDANLWLGRINEEFFCGGAVKADRQAVERALTELGAPLDLTADDVARGILRLANSSMVNALKLVSINRGHDPRDFTLVAFGGGGGMHAVALAAELGMRKVVIPHAADVFSAWGMLMSDLRRDYFVTRPGPLSPASATEIDELLGEMAAAALDEFERDGVDPADLRLTRAASLRYENQEHGVEVELPPGVFDGAAVDTTIAAFHEAYEREYTYRLDAPVELVAAHLTATANVGRLEAAPLPVSGRPLVSASKGTRRVDYLASGAHDAAIFDGDLLEAGMAFTGPAIVETKGTTTVIHPGNRVEVDPYGNLHIRLGDAQ